LTTSDREVVAALRQAIAQRIGEPRYQFWFAANTRFAWQDGVLVVGVPNHFYQEWLARTFGEAVHQAAADVLGRPMQVQFNIDPELFQAARRAQAQEHGNQASSRATVLADPTRAAEEGPAEKRRQATAPPTARAATQTDAPAERQAPRPTKRTRRWHRLSDFVVGSCNRMAHAAALSVIEAPGEAANPLVLHGPVGTGKTHLLEAIYAALRRQHPDWRVVFVTAEEFTNRFVQALRLGKLGPFRGHFRECDVLLADDVQFLAKTRASQEEFLHTFDALHADGRQVVVTADCHPQLAGELSPLLTDRLVGGACWSLMPPEVQTRAAILRHRAGGVGRPAPSAAGVGRPAPSAGGLPEEVIDFLAGQLRGNVRELEGALHTLRHYSQVAGRPIDMALAREALGELIRHAVRVIQLEDVDRAVCRALRLEPGALQGKQRAWAVSHPRMLAMYLARKHTAAAYSEIGRHFGGRNHSTAVAAEKKVRQWLADDGTLVLGQHSLRVRDGVELAERELLR
jgi:chromosomal replication initiator protein